MVFLDLFTGKLELLASLGYFVAGDFMGVLTVIYMIFNRLKPVSFTCFAQRNISVTDSRSFFNDTNVPSSSS